MSEVTVKQAAEFLKVSESTVRAYINKGILKGEKLNKQFISLDSIKELQKTRGYRKNRATLVLGFLGSMIGTVPAIVWDEYKGLDDKNLSKTEIRSVFNFWDKITLHPGQTHPKWGGLHPDVKHASREIVKLTELPEDALFVGYDGLPDTEKQGNLLLIGGPISNDLSCELHGYKFLNENKISIKPSKNIGTRWSFYFPVPEKGDLLGFSRFVEGEEIKTWPKAIEDNQLKGAAKGPIFSPFDPHTGRIISDFLLITVVPNQLTKYSSGSTIVDVADLHGQGNKAFSQIISNKDRLKELMDAVDGKRYYQALYEVFVSHDDYQKTTNIKKIELVDRFFLV
ncbi:helix-turn-helix domain-containing protein [Pareuzebyella sediminis]|uniref:helix-turn-helix domain-containing protein n=1 Tax=Pareuzebyella sediminis TaxID=2607998 RepID=UPI0011EC6DF9|nr:helix-turn-helix domain-containing protein [Pareuzebyella sediminis]